MEKGERIKVIDHKVPGPGAHFTQQVPSSVSLIFVDFIIVLN
jgi:hypothetical protein